MSNKTYDFDFGFTFEDDPFELQEQIVSETKLTLEQEVAQKLQEVERLILPLLENLKKNPERDYIHWPGSARTKVINDQIEKIISVTRYYNSN